MNEQTLIVDCGYCKNKQALKGSDIDKYNLHCIEKGQKFFCKSCQNMASQILLKRGIDLRLHKNPYPTKKGKPKVIQSIPIYETVGDKKVLKGYKYLKHGQ